MFDVAIGNEASVSRPGGSVYSGVREEIAAGPAMSEVLLDLCGRRNISDGLEFMRALPDGAAALAFFDPEYRAVLDRLSYGNEGKGRQAARSALAQMPEAMIRDFIAEIVRVLRPRGHLMLWLDKFEVALGVHRWFDGQAISVVDLVTWDKGRIGMGYRTRRRAEYLVIAQKLPLRAKGVWTRHDIPDVWQEKVQTKVHAHAKPIGLQAALIEATTAAGELVLDPAAGSYSVMAAAHSQGRRFLGCDLVG